MTFPFFVILNLFAAALLVFCFGILSPCPEYLDSLRSLGIEGLLWRNNYEHIFPYFPWRRFHPSQISYRYDQFLHYPSSNIDVNILTPAEEHRNFYLTFLFQTLSGLQQTHIKIVFGNFGGEFYLF